MDAVLDTLLRANLGNGSAFCFVALKQRLSGFAVDSKCELVRKVVDVCYASVETQAARGWERMSCISGPARWSVFDGTYNG